MTLYCTLLEKGVLYTVCSIGFFTQLQMTFCAKKRFYNDKKEPVLFFIGYYSFIYYIILQYFVVVIKLLFIKLNITF